MKNMINDIYELESAHQQISNGINKVKENKKDDELINVIVAKENKNNWKINPLNSFVMLFMENLETILINYKLNNSDMLVLVKILQYMSFGNQINITQKEIAKAIGKDQPAVCRSYKKLKKSKIILCTENKSEYINPQLIIKGNFKKQTESLEFNELTNKSPFKNYDQNSFKKNYDKN